MENFSHIDEGMPVMVDVGNKASTFRTAHARAIVWLPDNVAEKLSADDLVTAKGSVFHTAVIAGIMAAKNTGALIPLCHMLSLSKCDITIRPVPNNELHVDCVCKVNGQTGVEMEALVGVSVAALTIYDMCKALSHDIVIRETKLISKTGGKSDYHVE
jgi:cyclic pyranopterin phosphate synthase